MQISVKAFVLFGCSFSYAWGQSVCGAIIDTYKGVNAYSNGDNTGTLASCQSESKAGPLMVMDPAGFQALAGEDGEQYQCVEFVRRFYREAVCPTKACSVSTSKWSGDAQYYYSDAGRLGLIPYANGGAIPPQRDDIIGFSTAANDLGHVAVVKDVDTSVCSAGITSAQFDVHLIEQNTQLERRVTGRCDKRDDGTYSYTLIPRSIPIQGWLRVPPVLPAPAGYVYYVQEQGTSFIEEKQSSSDQGSFPIDVSFPLIGTIYVGKNPITLVPQKAFAQLNISRSQPGCHISGAGSAIHVYVYPNVNRSGPSMFHFDEFENDPNGSGQVATVRSTVSDGVLTTLAANTVYYVFITSQCAGDRLRIETNSNHQFIGVITTGTP